MSVGEQITFRQLLDKGTRIEIPIIQRDYAQGRETVSEVREQFLTTIYSKLATQPEKLEQPLDMDFIYGSLDETLKKFSPLDGQQRLTTLFLLHWYLAFVDGKSDEFRSLVLDGDDSRFTYQTRTSSTEFFHALAKASIDLPDLLRADVDIALSEIIQDCQWFFLSWHQDPTIQSALVMLDAIHARFSKSKGFYDRLIQTEKPYITFQFLNLKEFGLSDELYIKMNARGKALTPFENFKARLEQHIDKIYPDEKKKLGDRGISIKDYFSHKVDTQWADLFWNYRDLKQNVFDEQIMNFIRSLAGNYYPHNRQDWTKGLQELRAGHIDFTFLKYDEIGCFDDEFIKTLIDLLDVISSDNKKLRKFLSDTAYYDEELIFKKSLVKINPKEKTGLEYEESVQFFAYSSFIVRHRDHIDPVKFYEWMRVIANLTVNTPHNDLHEFRASLVSVKALIDHADNILEYIAGNESYKAIKGFYTQQVREEHIKANLISKSVAWKVLILRAEQHGYFKGQIEFLLSFSGVLDYYLENDHCDWSKEEDAVFIARFSTYLEKVSAVFDSNGLKTFPDFLWERALLAAGDYMLYAGRNHSFLDDTSRDTSWKRLLRGTGRAKGQGINEKRDFVKIVLDQFSISDPSGSLASIVKTAVIDENWRKRIVEQPATIGYCERRAIRKNADNIYLLSKSQMNSYHHSLYSYHLMLSIIEPRQAANKLAPFAYAFAYAVATEEDEPYIRLSGCKLSNGDLVLDISYFNTQFRFKLFLSSGGELTVSLRNKLVADLDFQIVDGAAPVLYVPIELVESQLGKVIDLLNDYVQEHNNA